jgi:hypothetical protein
VSVRFNSPFSIGTPDITGQLLGPTSSLLQPWQRVGSGFELSFEATQDGEHFIVLDNLHSRLDAKQVTLQFFGQVRP